MSVGNPGGNPLEGPNWDPEPLLLWGRCKSGRRWFWAADNLEGGTPHGWEDTEDQAVAAAARAVTELAAGRTAKVIVRHGVATRVLRTINAQKRAARPSSTATATAPVEYLYAVIAEHHDGNDNWVPATVVSFRITHRTPKRVFYVRREHGENGPVIGYVDRAVLERDGEVYNRSAGWWGADFHLLAEKPDVLEFVKPQAPTVKQLKAAMAAAHPDRGGTDEEFVAARGRYRRALATESRR